MIANEPGELPVHDSEIYTPSARPGFLAPHAWLPDGRSLYDAFGRDFTLLIAAGADPAEVHDIRARIFATEDEPMIAAQQARIGTADFWSLRPALLKIDKGAVAVCRRMDNLIAAEVGVAAPGMAA